MQMTTAYRCRCDVETMPWTGGGTLAVCPRCGGRAPAPVLDGMRALDELGADFAARLLGIETPAQLELAERLRRDRALYGCSVVELVWTPVALAA